MEWVRAAAGVAQWSVPGVRRRFEPALPLQRYAVSHLRWRSRDFSTNVHYFDNHIRVLWLNRFAFSHVRDFAVNLGER